MILLLTGCINANGMSFTALSNLEERKRQYISAIRYYISNTNFQIVFSENSGTDISPLFQEVIDSGRMEYLTFNGNQCTITSDDEEIPSDGSGEFIIKGTEKPEYKDYQWGNMNGKPIQRDILRLAYNVTFKKGRVIGKKTVNGKEVDWILENDVQISTNDTLVVQTRESNKKEFFSPKYILK